ncbi:hypothetical protein BG011_000790 [Mortierella polycephala]|uniref:JmjC domain-containing protein n=1 Tax=Mortierella polycephala TaxID=41804 RepID=A0A9P6PL77_9FUNG|nr:hypothetical protein BG011_000790 [Mortierella polycephala]
MVWADNGSSIWFIIAANDMPKVEALWQTLGHDPEFENYFASVDELALADFPIYVIEQKPGDLVLIPSMSHHQVVNLVQGMQPSKLPGIDSRQVVYEVRSKLFFQATGIPKASFVISADATFSTDTFIAAFVAPMTAATTSAHSALLSAAVVNTG